VSDIIEKDGKTSRLSMPINRRANDFEPIVEIAWKVFVNAHSYCFNHFSDYYNDHHSYTVSLLPFFTNEIQEIWYTSKCRVTLKQYYWKASFQSFPFSYMKGTHRNTTDNSLLLIPGISSTADYLETITICFAKLICA